jgi:hypothetical protein
VSSSAPLVAPTPAAVKPVAAVLPTPEVEAELVGLVALICLAVRVAMPVTLVKAALPEWQVLLVLRETVAWLRSTEPVGRAANWARRQEGKPEEPVTVVRLAPLMGEALSRSRRQDVKGLSLSEARAWS